MAEYYDPATCPLADAELHVELAKYDSKYAEKGKLTDGQRQIRIKRLNHYLAQGEKERKAQEKKEKEQAKQLNASMANTSGVGRGRKRKSVAPVTGLNSTFISDSNPGAAGDMGKYVVPISPEKIPTTPQKTSAVKSSAIPCVDLIVTDTTRGAAAAGLYLELFGLDKKSSWKSLAQRSISNDGDCPGLITRDLFERGVYKLVLNTGEYFERMNVKAFHPHIEVEFAVENPMEKFRLHVCFGVYDFSCSRCIVAG